MNHALPSPAADLAEQLDVLAGLLQDLTEQCVAGVVPRPTQTVALVAYLNDLSDQLEGARPVIRHTAGLGRDPRRRCPGAPLTRRPRR